MRTMGFGKTVALLIVLTFTVQDVVCSECVETSCPEGQGFSRAFCACDSCENICVHDGCVEECLNGCGSYCDKQTERTDANDLCFQTPPKESPTPMIPTPSSTVDPEDYPSFASSEEEKKQPISIKLLCAYILTAVFLITSIVLGFLCYRYWSKLRKQQALDSEDPSSANSLMLRSGSRS